MAQRVFSNAHREVLWKLTSGRRPTTLPRPANLDDPGGVPAGERASRGGRRQIAGNAGWLRTAERRSKRDL